MSEKLMSISAVAANVGLSRQRFHQLMKQGIFPPPIYDIHTRRPHYTEEMLKICMTVREKNVGVNGKVVLFYARRSGAAQKKQISRQRSALPKRAPQHSGLIAGLKGLGLLAVTELQIEAALMELYPRGTAGVGEADMLRTVFVHLMRRN